MTVKVAPKVEPIYVVRSNKNTYCISLDDFLGTAILNEQEDITCCDRIMKATRKIGVSVEAYFKKYGTIS